MSTAPSSPDFSQSVAALYERYMVPMQFAPYARVVAERFAGSGGRFLETATGTGVLARELAVASDRRIVATDLTPPMLELARTGAPAPNVEWQLADAQALPFEDASFDTVVCQFGAMFFPDKPQAFREAHRVLRAGGTFVLLLWDRLEENEIALAVAAALDDIFPDDPAAFIRNVPHGYHDRARIASDLRSGGFEDITFETLTLRSTAGSAAEAAVAICAGTPLRNALAARTSGDLTSTIDAVTAALQRRFGTGPIDAKMQALLVEARR